MGPTLVFMQDARPLVDLMQGSEELRPIKMAAVLLYTSHGPQNGVGTR